MIDFMIEKNISNILLIEEFSNFGMNNLKVKKSDFTHPNKYGHEIAAEKIYGWLKNSSLA